MGMTIEKWEPFRDLMVMQARMTRLIDETLSRIWKEEVVQGVWSPPVDILERVNGIVMEIDLPGMRQNEIEIRAEENTLTIQGERRFIKDASDENYIQVERPYGTFRRTFNIPRTIDQEGIKASYKEGVLRVVLPRKPETQTKQIVVDPK
jgi:HSP20 family protein